MKTLPVSTEWEAGGRHNYAGCSEEKKNFLKLSGFELPIVLPVA
jgi:hypothetical protein